VKRGICKYLRVAPKAQLFFSLLIQARMPNYRKDCQIFYKSLYFAYNFADVKEKDVKGEGRDDRKKDA
jgi:hypothetical protein